MSPPPHPAGSTAPHPPPQGRRGDASPKSISSGLSLLVHHHVLRLHVPGERSPHRVRTPELSASFRTSRAHSKSGNPPRSLASSNIVPSVRPRMNAETMKCRPPSSPFSNRGTMLGCRRFPADRASRRNRLTLLRACRGCPAWPPSAPPHDPAAGHTPGTPRRRRPHRPTSVARTDRSAPAVQHPDGGGEVALQVRRRSVGRAPGGGVRARSGSCTYLAGRVCVAARSVRLLNTAGTRRMPT